jgi:hypothetical protein
VPAWTAALRLDTDSGYTRRNFIFLNTITRYLHQLSSSRFRIIPGKLEEPIPLAEGGAFAKLLHIGTLVYNAVSTISFRKFVRAR